MAVELKVPSAGESITEVVITEWLKKEGSHAERDEPIALIETDKANVEVMAPASGTLARILKPAGETVRVGEVIGLFEPGGAASAVEAKREETERTAAEKKAQSTVVHAPQVVHAEKSEVAPTPKAAEPAPSAAEPAPKAPAHQNGGGRGEPGISPSMRRALRESDVRPEEVRPLRPDDVKRLRERAPSPQADVGAGDLRGARALAPRAEPATVPPPVTKATSERAERTVAMTPLRRRVAERLVSAQQTAALLTTFNEIDMTAVMALRKQHVEAFKERHGVKLGFMSFFVKAAIEGLRAFPAINAEIRGTDIIYHDYTDIGVAVGGGKGLVVPVIRNAEKKSFAELERTIADFGERAKAGRLKVEELQGGTFTISNGGVYGSLMSTPIVNPPESGILGMHAIQERPVARNGQVVIAPMMYVALTYDHRIVDGREAVGFLVRVKECVENPTRLLLEV